MESCPRSRVKTWEHGEEGVGHCSHRKSPSVPLLACQLTDLQVARKACGAGLQE